MRLSIGLFIFALISFWLSFISQKYVTSEEYLITSCIFFIVSKVIGHFEDVIEEEKNGE